MRSPLPDFFRPASVGVVHIGPAVGFFRGAEVEVCHPPRPPVRRSQTAAASCPRRSADNLRASASITRKSFLSAWYLEKLINTGDYVRQFKESGQDFLSMTSPTKKDRRGNPRRP